jgi:hypothetical protein
MTIYDASIASYSFNVADTYKGDIGMSSGGGWLSTFTNDPFRFITNNTERMRITSGGFVGIGTSSPNDKLVVDGGNNIWTGVFRGTTTTSQSFGVQIFGGTNSSDTAFRILNGATTSTYFFVRGDGFVNAGTFTYNNAVTGRTMVVESGGGLGYLVSTRESKDNIQSIKNVDFINKLNPVSFNYRKKNDVTNQFTDELYDNVTYGFIADEVEKVNKDLVFYKEDGITLAGVEYNNMIAILTKAVQELEGRIKQLENK